MKQIKSNMEKSIKIIEEEIEAENKMGSTNRSAVRVAYLEELINIIKVKYE